MDSNRCIGASNTCCSKCCSCCPLRRQQMRQHWPCCSLCCSFCPPGRQQILNWRFSQLYHCDSFSRAYCIPQIRKYRLPPARERFTTLKRFYNSCTFTVGLHYNAVVLSGCKQNAAAIRQHASNPRAGKNATTKPARKAKAQSNQYGDMEE